jgi:predicted ATP-dependent endonuclease of OLD family
VELRRFCVQNYKKANDTGWINCSQLNSFVGKNESGKSAVFRALSKLNPSDGQRYDPRKEFPRRRYNEYKTKDWPVASAVFGLSKADKEALIAICPLLSSTEETLCTRYYSGWLTVEFLPKTHLPDSSSISSLAKLMAEWSDVVENLSVSSPEHAEQLKKIKSSLITFFREKSDEYSSQNPSNAPVTQAQISEISAAVHAVTNEQWAEELLKPIRKGIMDFRISLELLDQLNQAEDWVAKNFPQFIYFDNYDVLDSAVHVPTFMNQINRDPTAPKVRTTKALFEHLGLNMQSIQKLDPNQPNKQQDELRKMADERFIQMSSASNQMTERFSSWWEQRKHKFRYAIDGSFFRVWVSDDLDPSEIELDERSLGLQYFFSFYLVFLVEAKGAHRNSILLLDEPGGHLHGTAQQMILGFLRSLSKENQLFYTTHSPFMIDKDHLEEVRVVYEDKSDGSTKVSDVWPKDRDSLFPLEAALAYSIAQKIFDSPKQLVVESVTDCWMLKAMNSLLAKKGFETLREDVDIVPAGGLDRLLPLAAVMASHETKLSILFDGGESRPGNGKEIGEPLLKDSLFFSSFAGRKGAEIEDLLPESFYRAAVEKAYSRAKGMVFTPEENSLPSIAKRYKAAFRRMGLGDFEKSRADRVVLDWIQGGESKKISRDSLDRFASIFSQVNTITQ